MNFAFVKNVYSSIPEFLKGVWVESAAECLAIKFS